MSTQAEKFVPSAKRPNTKEIVVGFDAEKFRAPVLLRCGALLIDYILFISIPVLSLLIGRYMGDDGAKLLNSSLNNIGWLTAFAIAVGNFIIFPFFSSQTIGKMLTGLKITTLEGKPASVLSLFLRHFIGYPLTLLTGGLGFFVSLFNQKGRALHDLISGTIVVYGQQTIKRSIIAEKLRSKNSLK